MSRIWVAVCVAAVCAWSGCEPDNNKRRLQSNDNGTDDPKNDESDEVAFESDGGSKPTSSKPQAGPVSDDALDDTDEPTPKQPHQTSTNDGGAPLVTDDASVVSNPGVDLKDVEPTVVDPVDASVPVCGVGAKWSAPKVISDAKSVRVDRVHSVTPDGKSWLVSSRSANGPEPQTDAGTYSDAGMVLDPFEYFIVDLPDGPEPLALPPGFDLSRGAALSPDGLRLVVVNELPASLSELRREKRGQSFDSPDEEPFTRLRGSALQTGYAYESPAYSASGDHLYISARVREVHQIRQLTLTDQRWNTAWVMNDLQLLLDDPWVVTLSSASSDSRTLFLWDAGRREALVADLSEFGEPTGDIEKIGLKHPVFVNDDCTRLFTLNDDGIPAMSVLE